MFLAVAGGLFLSGRAWARMSLDHSEPLHAPVLVPVPSLSGTGPMVLRYLAAASRTCDPRGRSLAERRSAWTAVCSLAHEGPFRVAYYHGSSAADLFLAALVRRCSVFRARDVGAGSGNRVRVRYAPGQAAGEAFKAQDLFGPALDVYHGPKAPSGWEQERHSFQGNGARRFG